MQLELPLIPDIPLKPGQILLRCIDNDGGTKCLTVGKYYAGSLMGRGKHYECLTDKGRLGSFFIHRFEVVK